MTFKNEKELKDFLLQKCNVAIAQAEEKVNSVIDSFLQNFYSWEPKEYIRTRQLLHSLVRTGVRQVGNGFVAEIYFDVGKLNYDQGMMPLKHTPEHGRYGWATWDGQKVLDVAMTDGLPHGRYAGADNNESIWTSSMNELGNILDLLEQELRAQGIPIKK